MHPRTPCPDAEAYRQLFEGDATESAVETLCSHLEFCAVCSSRFDEDLGVDTLRELVRQARLVPVPGPSVCGLMDQLTRLRPGYTDTSRVEPQALQPSHSPSPAPGFPSVRTEPSHGIDSPECLGPYHLLEILGTGGMGVVHRARDQHLDRMVALKVMLPALATSSTARNRFLQEGRAVAALKHEHVVSIYQVGEDRGLPYLAMELLDGESLETRLHREGQLPVAEILRIGREIALGLEAAHSCGIIHRDIKPANIWLEGPTARVKILDFGLARAARQETVLTQAGVIVGTPAYMAPEQGQSRGVDARSDLFSLGCVLYQMAVGEAPFRGADLISTLLAVSTSQPPQPHKINARLPPHLSRFILTLLAKKPEDRPESAREAITALERLAREHPPSLGAHRPAWYAGGILLCLLLSAWIGVWAGGFLSVQTPDGTLVLENIPAEAEVRVDGVKVQIRLERDGKAITVQVPPGERKLQIRVAGFEMTTQDITLATGERKPLRIHLEPLAPVPEKPEPVAPPTRPQTNFKALFNDTDLTGWDPANPGQITWRNDKGTITGVNRGTHPSSGGTLFTRREYSDFHFRCEVLASRQPSGSMVYFRHNRSLVTGARRGHGIHNPGTAATDLEEGWGIGSLYEDVFQVGNQRVTPSLIKDLGIRPGEWYTLEIVAHGEILEVFVNGKKTVRYRATNPPARKGVLGLGCPMGVSVSFRNVAIQE